MRLLLLGPRSTSSGVFRASGRPDSEAWCMISDITPIRRPSAFWPSRVWLAWKKELPRARAAEAWPKLLTSDLVEPSIVVHYQPPSTTIFLHPPLSTKSHCHPLSSTDARRNPPSSTIIHHHRPSSIVMSVTWEVSTGGWGLLGLPLAGNTPHYLPVSGWSFVQENILLPPFPLATK